MSCALGWGVMPNWPFPTSASRNTSAAAVQESFDLLCCCGQQIVGERQAQPQIAECSLCRERYLILPANPYPPPLPAGTTRRKKKSKKAKGGPVLSAAGLATTWKTWGQPIAAFPISWGKTGAKTAVRTGQNLWARLVAFYRGILAQITLLRFVVSLICALIGLTIYWQVRESRLEEAMVLANAAYDRGMTALEKKEMVAALAEFEDSRQAMDLLERDDMQARQVRQYAKELGAATQLATSSLFDVLTEGVREQRSSGSASWNERFSRKYAGDWLILELKGQGVLSSKGGDSPSLVFPSVFMGQPVALEIPQSILAQMPTIQDEVSLIVAVQWQECRFEEQPSPRWVATFNPQTAFLWVNLVTYEAAGYVPDEYQPDDELKRILVQQAKWVMDN